MRSWEWPAAISEQIEHVLADLERQHPRLSRFQSEVFEHLRSGGSAWQQELFVAGYFIDCADLDAKIAVECDGNAYHYTSDGHLLGKDILKDRILVHLGWRVIRIKQSEWERQTDRNSYLHSLLAEVA